MIFTTSDFCVFDEKTYAKYMNFASKIDGKAIIKHQKSPPDDNIRIFVRFDAILPPKSTLNQRKIDQKSTKNNLKTISKITAMSLA